MAPSMGIEGTFDVEFIGNFEHERPALFYITILGSVHPWFKLHTYG